MWYNRRMDITRRRFFGGLASLGALGGSQLVATAADAMNCVSPKLKFGVVSDVHVRLAADGRTLAAGYETDTLEKTFAHFRDQGVDAVMIAGDMADLGLTRELKAIADAWFKVFPGDRAPDGRKVERLFVLGNHDAFGLRNGARVFKDADVLAREAIQADPKKAWAECFNEEWQPYYTKNVKGFDFFCSHWQPGVWCNGVAETGCAGCGDAFRALMEKCDPARPFFYVQHPHPRDTVYGKCAWGMDDGSATRLLANFPQAIAFSGHSHEPLTNEKSIWRGAFTSVGTGSLRYLSADAVWSFERTAGYENGKSNVYLPGGVRREDRTAIYAAYDSPKMMAVETNRPDIRVGQIISVYDDRVEFAKREFVSGLPLGDDWIVELPAKPRSFVSFARAAKPAEFPEGSVLSATRTTAKTRGQKRNGGDVAPQEKDAIRLDFPAATVGGQVAEYEICAANAGGSVRAVRICAINGLYPRRHAKFAKAVTATIPADALPVGVEVVRVTPLDSYGNRGRALEAKISGSARG